MVNRKVIIEILLAVVIALPGCTIGTQNGSPDKSKAQVPEPSMAQKSSQGHTQQPVKETDPIEEQVRSMTLEEKIGQMVIVGLDGYTMDENARSMINNYHVGGFILFGAGANVKNSRQLLALINSLKNTNLKNKAPLFISVDEEGGRINRMPGEFKKLPTNDAIGKMNNAGLSYKIGGVLAEEIKAFGFNVDFAPVLDVNSNPKNPVIGDRSFGADVNVVSRLGVKTMKGIQAGGVIPVVKHFPGHGDTSVDSHIGLPVIYNDMKRLKSLELIPFEYAIKNGADAVMIAHILLKKIDPLYPASLSKTIITDLLRKQLNFGGVIITDDMTMGAIVKNYDIGDAAVRSVNAGSDIVLVCHDRSNEVAVLGALKKAVEDGIILEKRIDKSVYAILKLKYKYKLADNIINSIDVKKINNKISTVLNAFPVNK